MMRDGMRMVILMAVRMLFLMMRMGVFTARMLVVLAERMSILTTRMLTGIAAGTSILIATGVSVSVAAGVSVFAATGASVCQRLWSRYLRGDGFRRVTARLTGGEEGSGSILAVAVLASVVAVCSLVIPVSLALGVKQQVESAADAAALAAANTASGAVPGYPCQSAARAAELNKAHLGRCDVDGAIATVTAAADYLMFSITAIARAGPPSAKAGTG